MQKSLLVRAVIYVVVFLYLLGDLYCWHGGVYRLFHHEKNQKSKMLAQHLSPARERENFLRGGDFADQNPSAQFLQLQQRALVSKILQQQKLTASRPNKNSSPLSATSLALPFPEKNLAIEQLVAKNLTEWQANFDEKNSTATNAAFSKEKPKLIHARHIFLPTLNKDNNQVRTEIGKIHHHLAQFSQTDKLLAEFAEAARLFSDDQTSKENSGKLPPFALSELAKLDAKLAKKLAQLPPNQLSPPLPSRWGWHIFWVGH